jgi:hypothetical protein
MLINIRSKSRALLRPRIKFQQIVHYNFFIWTFDSICISSFDGKRFGFFIVDDYTIFT